MPPRFEKHFQSDGSFRWWDTRTCRYYDAGQYELVAWLAAGNTPAEVAYVPPPAPPVPVLRMSKLKLRRNLRAAGLERILDAMLEANPEAAKDFAAATELLETDAMLQAMIPVFLQASGLAKAEVRAIMQASALE